MYMYFDYRKLINNGMIGRDLGEAHYLDTPTWKAMLLLLPGLRRHTSVRLGNGAMTSFWQDHWLGSTSLADLMPALFSNAQRPNMSVNLNQLHRRNSGTYAWRRDSPRWRKNSSSFSYMLYRLSTSMRPLLIDVVCGRPLRLSPLRACTGPCRQQRLPKLLRLHSGTAMLHPKPSNSSGSSKGSGYPPELSSFTATLLTLRNVLSVNMLSVNMKKTKLSSSSSVLRLLYAGVFCVPGRISPILRLAVCGVMSFWKAWKTTSKPLSLSVFSGTFGRAEMHTPSRGKTCHLPSPCAGLWLISFCGHTELTVLRI
ncbi:hypothetical protein C2845_PM06G08660 [Panicum miliaceum]|uniref:Uncharacterized protein n=1 Tax=Panicum miliaceum TaxID=4540 RepID=A0A3L6RFG9_PANMI|nr:hypothetical protein C2845_PM06G08660 [Panicum miliaceum]